MRNSLLFSVLLCFLGGCNFDIVEHEVKTVAQIKGSIIGLTDSTLLQVLCFSGYNENQKDVWTQVVAYDPNKGERLRIISPLVFGKSVREFMTYRTISFTDEKSQINIDSLNLEGLDEEAKEAINQIIPQINYTFTYSNTDSIKVFFNPKFKEIEEQSLPIVIGRLE